MILKTYTRLLTTDLESTLRTLRPLHRGDVHFRFRFEDWDLVCIGDILIVAGSAASLEPLRGALGPWIVDDLEATKARLLESGAEITQDIQPSDTGRFIFARHIDGTVAEYVQWKPELVESLIRTPQAEGLLSSQL